MEDLLLRCLDASHAAACQACVPAPDESAAGRFVLGLPAHLRQLGRPAEKHLRTLLSLTPEWRSDTERELLASKLAASTPKLAKALRERRCSALRKGDMLALAREWRYKSDLWR